MDPLVEHYFPGNIRKIFCSFPFIAIFIEEMYLELCLFSYENNVETTYYLLAHDLNLSEVPTIGRKSFISFKIFGSQVICVPDFKYSTCSLCGRTM